MISVVLPVSILDLPSIKSRKIRIEEGATSKTREIRIVEVQYFKNYLTSLFSGGV